MKNFKHYLTIIQEEKEILNEGVLSEKIAPVLISLSMILSSLSAKNKNDHEQELYDKLQQHIQNVIKKNEKKKELLKQQIEKILQSKKGDDYKENQYKNFLDEIVQNKSIEIDGVKYDLKISDQDRELVDEILGERKTYQSDVKEAAKYILSKIK